MSDFEVGLVLTISAMLVSAGVYLPVSWFWRRKWRLDLNGRLHDLVDQQKSLRQEISILRVQIDLLVAAKQAGMRHQHPGQECPSEQKAADSPQPMTDASIGAVCETSPLVAILTTTVSPSMSASVLESSDPAATSTNGPAETSLHDQAAALADGPPADAANSIDNAAVNPTVDESVATGFANPVPPSTRSSPSAQSVPSGQSANSAKSAPPSVSAPSVEPGKGTTRFDWESLVGVRLFSWIAGITLLIATVFFLRYSVQQGWMSPLVRVVMGVVTGVLLLVACETKRAQSYRVTARALAAAGIAMLFATFFAAHSRWNLIGTLLTFMLLALVAAVAVALSIRRDSFFIALLGLVGGFVTPILLSTGHDQAIGLFSYLLLLNVALAAVAYRKNWPMLIAVSLAFTSIYQVGWIYEFFEGRKIPLAMGIFLVFPIFGYGALIWSRRHGAKERPAFAWITTIGAFGPLLFAIYLTFFLAVVPVYGNQFAWLFGYLFLLAIGLAMVAAFVGPEWMHLIGAGTVLIVFAGWVGMAYSPSDWPWMLLVIALFIAVYLAMPLLVSRMGRALRASGKLAVYAAPLLLFVFPVLAGRQIRPDDQGLFWGTLLVLMAVLAAYAIQSKKGGIHFIACVFALATLAIWSIEYQAAINAILVLALFSLVVHFLARRRDVPGRLFTMAAQMALFGGQTIAAFSPLADECPRLMVLVVAHCLLLLAMLWIAWRSDRAWSLVGAVITCALAVGGWRFMHGSDFAGVLWLATPLYLMLLFQPWANARFRVGLPNYLASVAASAVYFLFAREALVQAGWEQAIGLLPVAQALLFIPHLWFLARVTPQSQRNHGQIALVAAAVLALVTVAIPLQLQKQWITLGWALQGAALAWLYQRVRHRGLVWWLTALMVAVFIRLALNPSILDYHSRSFTPIINWYLYTYLVSATCYFVAARWLASRDDRLWSGGPRVSSILPTMGVILLFLLLNIEIADFWSEGSHITFDFSAGLARDLSYTMGWALFAIGLLVTGIIVKKRFTRIASLALLVVTILKAFLHDLHNLSGLYLVASLMGLGISLALVAVVLQRFVLSTPREKQ